MSDFARPVFLRRFLWALRLRGPAADDSTAQTLHALALMLLCLLATHVGIAEHNNPSKLLITIIGIPALGTPVATLLLLRRGAVRASGIVYLTGMWVYFTAVISLNGGTHHIGVAVYISLSVSAAWLFGYGAALLTAGMSFAALLVMTILETYVVGPRHVLPGTPFGLWFFIMESMLMGVVPVTLVLSSLRQALAQSHRAEAELQLHQQHLEELVQQRTAELVVARDQADAANRAKSAFLANMSHELRTPLNAILGFTTLIHDDPGLSGQHRRDLDIVKRSGEHLLSMIDDILDVAKIEAGRMGLEKTSFRLHDLLQDSVELMRPRAEEKGLMLVLQQSTAVPCFVRGDGVKLRQVLNNLIGNAVKYTAQGSVVVNADAKIGSAGLILSLAVADTGIGIAPEDQVRIFDPFVQAGHNGAQKGTGLGLAITRRFVELMGGNLLLQSSAGSGSVFQIELPVEEGQDPGNVAADGGQKQIAGLAPGQPDYRILIVEDQAENWMVLKRILEGAGFPVRVAEDGEQAVEVFGSWQPHFIWMDLRLPGMSGIEAARCIRKMEGGSKVKIVALSASAFSAQRDEVLASGLDGFLRKPFRSEEIFEWIARLLGVRYEYREEMTRAKAQLSLPRGSLAALAHGLREELAEALVRLDPPRITAVIDRISETDAELGGLLARHADRFAYTKVLHALHSIDGQEEYQE